MRSGCAGSVVVHRRRRTRRGARGAGAARAGLRRDAGRGAGPGQPRRQHGRGHDAPRFAAGTRPVSRPGQSLDSATASRLGLPTAPSRSFAPPDSVVNALMERRGYSSDPLPGRLGHCLRRRRARAAGGRGADRAARRAARGGHDQLPDVTAASSTRRAIRTCSIRARSWWARGSATTPAAGAAWSTTRSPTSPRARRSGFFGATWPRIRAPAGSTPAPARSPAATCRRPTTTSPRAK